MVLDSTGGFDKFPDMLCMKMVYKDKIGVVTLFSSQERRALAVPRMNRLSTAGFVPPSVFLDMPCMKRAYRVKKASFHWSAARNKERCSSR